MNARLTCGQVQLEDYPFPDGELAVERGGDDLDDLLARRQVCPRRHVKRSSDFFYDPLHPDYLYAFLNQFNSMHRLRPILARCIITQKFALETCSTSQTS